MISFIGIMLAVAVLISVMSIMAGFRGTLMDRILSFNGHMYVQGPVLYAPDRDAALKRIADVPGVVAVTPLIESPAMFRAGGAATGGVVRGVRPQDLASTKFVYDSLTPEAREHFGKGQYGGDHVLIGKSLAEQMGLREGDPISLYSPTGADSAFGNLGGLEKTYIVGGIYTSGAADYDRAFIFMPLEQAQLFFGKDGVWDVIEMKVAEPDLVENLLTPVQRAAGSGSVVTDWRNRQAAIWGALKVERVAMSIILGMVVAIAAMNIISGIVMLVKNKTRDIAILRTVGASQSSILRIFFMSGRGHRHRRHHRRPGSGPAVLLEHRRDPAFPRGPAGRPAVQRRGLYAGFCSGQGGPVGRDLGRGLLLLHELPGQPAAVVERVAHRSGGGPAL
jgi:lipoprotein-releasing system permease protein